MITKLSVNVVNVENQSINIASWVPVLVGVQVKNRVGTWVKCINPMRNKVEHYFKKFPFYKYDFCEICLYEVQKRNGTLPITQGTPINHRPYSKPESDSL